MDVEHFDSGSSHTENWQGVLIRMIAEATFCEAYRTGNHGFAIVGRKTDREAVILTFTYLRSELRRLANHYHRAYSPEDISVNAWKRAFCLGACSTLKERLTSNRAKLLNEAPESSSVALVLTSRSEAVALWVKENLRTKASGRPLRYTGRDAYAHGREAGRHVAMTPRKQLGPK